MAKKESIKDQAIDAIIDGKISDAQLKVLLSSGRKLTPQQTWEIYRLVRFEEMREMLIKMPEEEFDEFMRDVIKNRDKYKTKVKNLSAARKKKEEKELEKEKELKESEEEKRL